MSKQHWADFEISGRLVKFRHKNIAMSHMCRLGIHDTIMALIFKNATPPPNVCILRDKDEPKFPNNNVGAVLGICFVLSDFPIKI
jgi:hypothetical protein